MIRTIIVDDEPRAIKTLQLSLERHCPEVTVVGTATNIPDGHAMIISETPDLIFLDINMPNGTGLELLAKMKPNHSGKVVFVTAYQEYAIQAFRLAAYDYLLKPIDKNRLIEVVGRVVGAAKELETIQLELLRELLEKKPRKIAINTTDRLFVLDMKDIVYVVSKRNYSEFHLTDTSLLATKQLGHFEELLSPHEFLRVHRSFLINISRVKEFRKKQLEVLMDDGTVIEVSRPRKELLLKKLMEG